jgi:selenocysteine-specific elongation factor
VHASAPDHAVAAIARLEQPFTLSQARQALGTTRRVAVPLLEHLDSTGRTVRVDAALRRLRTVDS